MPLSDTLADLNNMDVKIRWGVFWASSKKRRGTTRQPDASASDRSTTVTFLQIILSPDETSVIMSPLEG